jgi:stage II sporulation protein B
VENQKKSNTITIKIDGKSRTYQENKQQSNKEKVTSSKTFVEEGNQTLEFNRPPVEKPVINQPNYEEVAAASAEKEEEDFDWILPEPGEESELEEYKIASYTNTPKKGKGVIKALKKSKSNISPSIFFALFFAVIIGMSFGFILLRLVISDQTLGAEEVVTTVTPTEQTQQTTVETYTLPIVSTFVVQESAYSTLEKANEGKQILEQKGIPAAIITTDRSYLLVGIGETKENGKAIGEQLVDKGIEIYYAKEIQLGGSQINKITSSEQKLLEQASQLYAPLVTISTGLSLDQTPPEDASKKLNQLKGEWDKIKKDEIKNKALIQIKDELDKAITIAVNPSKEKSTELQQHLLSFLSLYQSEK